MAYTYDTEPLTTKAQVRAVGGLPAATPSDDTLDYLIDQATSTIETELQRHVIARDYAEWRDGSGARTLILDESPLNSVSRVSIGMLDALNVVNNSADSTEAYAEVDQAGTQLILTLLDGAAAGTTNLSFTAGGQTTLAGLATAVSAAAGTWTGTAATAYASYRSALLRPCGRRECYGSTATFQIPDESEADYTVDYAYGMIALPAGHGFQRGIRNVYVEYNAGYTTAPKALEQICIELVLRAYYTLKKDLAVKSETLGDYSYTLGGSVIIDPFILSSKEMQHRLMPFKNDPI